MLRKNEASLDESLRVLPGFFRVFSNALGVGPWFETYVKIGGGG
jgi:phospholipid/cholesterol/gamma-HCH transport system substrate-binding protein